MVSKVNILGIAGSPRSKSNSEILVKEALDASMLAGGRTDLYTIFSKKIASCTGCLACAKNGTICVIRDDFQTFYSKFILLIAMITPIIILNGLEYPSWRRRSNGNNKKITQIRNIIGIVKCN